MHFISCKLDSNKAALKTHTLPMGKNIEESYDSWNTNFFIPYSHKHVILKYWDTGIFAGNNVNIF